MRSLTSTLVAAITARLRRPIASLQVDWAGSKTSTSFSSTYDDLSPVLESVTVDRTVTTDLPEQAQLISGGAAAQVTARLSGDFPDGTSVAAALSPYAGLISRRLASSLLLRFGFVTDNGQEYTSQMVGNVRQVDVDAAERTASLTALDGRERMGVPIYLPAVANVDPGDGRLAPGFAGGWVMDYALRQNGVYRSPPRRSNVRMAQTNYGSTFPEVGWMGEAFRYAGGVLANKIGQPAWDWDATWHGWLLACQSGIAHYSYNYLTSPISVGNSSSCTVEIDGFGLSSTATDFRIISIADVDPIVNGYTFWVQATTGKVFVQIYRNGTASACTPIGSMSTSGKHYVLLTADISSGGVCTFRCQIDSTVTSTTFTPAGTASASAQVVLIAPNSDRNSWYGTTQVTTETSSAAAANQQNVDTLVSAGGPWRNAVLEQEDLPLTGSPTVENEDPWGLIQELAQADTGVALFDEDGIFRYYNRGHMSGGASTLTLTPTSHIKALAATELLDSVRNVVSVQTQQYMAMAATTVLWSLSEVVYLPPSGTRVFPVQLPGPLIGARPGTLNSGGTVNATAYQYSDGSGAAQAITWSWNPTSPTRGYITILNGTANDEWVVDSSGSPNLTLSGRCIVPVDNSYTAEVSDSTSIAAYGNQPITVSGNRWRQSDIAASTLASNLLARMKDPHPVLSDVPIVADLRLQLTDRVTIQEAVTLGLNTDFWVVGIATTFDRSGGASQTVTVRQV